LSETELGALARPSRAKVPIDKLKPGLAHVVPPMNVRLLPKPEASAARVPVPS